MSRLSPERLETLKNIANDLSSEDRKVIIFDGNYHPDGIVVDWKNRRVFAIECYTSSRSYSPAVADKVFSAGFDGMIVNMPEKISKHKILAEIRGEIVDLYAKGMTANEIVKHVEDIYEIKISRSTVYKIAQEYGIKKRLLSKDK